MNYVINKKNLKILYISEVKYKFYMRKNLD